MVKKKRNEKEAEHLRYDWLAISLQALTRTM